MRTSTLGDLLRHERRRLHMTQADLAEQLGTRPQTVSSWECGQQPQRRFMEPISRFLGLDPLELAAAIGRDGESSSNPGFEETPEVKASSAQDEVLRAIAARVKHSPPTPREMSFYERFMRAAGLRT